MKMFAKKKKSVPEPTPEETPPKKYPVVQFCSSTGWTYERVFLPLSQRIEEAGLFDDAAEVIACLNDSSRFKRHLCRKAEETLEAKRKELEEAEKAVKDCCHIGDA